MTTATEVPLYERMGFVCPDWAKPHWNPAECTIEKCTDGNYAVVCHQIQQTIFVARTRQECVSFLGNTYEEPHDPAAMPDLGEWLGIEQDE